jgi:putative N6-adenine-specific DNA methylase
MMMLLQYCAPCLFGLEGLLAEELRKIDALDVQAENGRVLFRGDYNILARANLCLRTAERVELVMGSFKAKSFEELFQGVKSLPWEDFIGKKDNFPVKGWSLNSALHSIPDCQSIIKKAIVNRLSAKYHIDWFEETDATVPVRFSILKDTVTLMLDTSGLGLHKRGYRANASEAPIKETLAAAMVMLARPYEDSVLYDPFCGSGTILIEGAMHALNVAPGLRRRFMAEKWEFIPQKVWQEERTRAMDAIRREVTFRCVGSDLNPAMKELALANAKKAGVLNRLDITTRDVKDFVMATPRGIVVTNPPYGERLLDIEEARRLYRTMGKVFEKQAGWRYAVISPDEEFQKHFGRDADKKRKLYNGMLKCNLYLYFK